MKWPSWLRGLVLLRSMVRSLDRIELQIRRLADAHEGISPAGREVVEEPAAPVVYQPPPATRPDDWVLYEAVERMLEKQLGHPPTPEQVAHELDGMEWGAGDLTPADRERLGL